MEPRALISLGKLALALVLTLTSNILLPDNSWAQIDVFARVEGLKCAGTDVRFPGAIIVRSLSGGISVAGSSLPPGGGIGGGRREPTIAPLKIAKDFDQCSPLLFRAAVVGQAFPRVTISFAKEGGSGFLFFEIELTDVMVQDMSLGATTGSGQDGSGSSLELNRYLVMIISTPCHDPCGFSSPEPYTT